MTTPPFITIASHKGGAGKTTMCASLAGALATAGHRVLAVDCDPQGALGKILGVRDSKPGLYEVLVGKAAAVEAVVETTTENVYLLPADLDLAGAEVQLPTEHGWRTRLRDALTELPADVVDVVLLDTAPGLGVLPYVALVAASHVLLVTQADYLGYEALPTMLESVAEAQRAAASPGLLGIVPTMVGARTRVESEVLELLSENYGGLLLDSIPRRVVFQEAGIAHRPVSHYAPHSDMAALVGALAEEVLRRAR